MPCVSKWVIRTCFTGRRRGIISRLYTKGVTSLRPSQKGQIEPQASFAVNLHNSRGLGGLSEDALNEHRSVQSLEK